MNNDFMVYIEWVGYLGSALVVVSIMMSSIIRLRWFNLTGAIIFSVYGFAIGALPVGLLNLFLTFVNVYYLLKIYNHKELFKVLPINIENSYLDFFADYYKKDISIYFPDFYENFKNQKLGSTNPICFLLLRNAAVAGVFMGTKSDNGELSITIDYVTPEYRDFKTGKFIYFRNLGYFASLGINKLTSCSKNSKHHDYLKKMGFISDTREGKSILYKLTS